MTTIRPRRRPLKAKEARAVAPVRKPASLARFATGPAARTVYVIVGAAGLAALAVAIIGPKRLERQVIRPLRGAIEPQAEKLWAEARPLREQFVRLMRNASPSGREKLVKSFQSWVGHFHAT